MTARRTAVVAVVIVGVLLALTLVVVASPSPPPGQSTASEPAVARLAPTVRSDVRRDARAAAARLLSEKADALRTGTSARALVLDPEGERGERELAGLARMRAMGVNSLHHEVVAVSSLGDGRHVVTVRGAYGLQTLAGGTWAFERTVEIARTPAGWRLVGSAEARRGRAIAPWDLIGARAVDAGSVVVVGNVDQATLERYAHLAVDALDDVAGLCGAPRLPVLLLAPARPDELTALLARREPVADEVAAITAGQQGPDGVERADARDVVALNPVAFAGITATGHDVVITHEIAHVLLRSHVSGRPEAWLAEGLADVVGYSASGLEDEEITAELLEAVRRGEGPDGLPTVSDLGGHTSDLTRSYQAAYLAVRSLQREYGRADVCRLYRASAVSSTDRQEEAMHDALKNVLGITEREFTRSWLEDLDALATGEGPSS